MTLVPTHVVAQNVVSLYSEARTSSEMVSQAVLGAFVQVLESQGELSFVEGEDRYRGWLLTRWLSPLSDTSDHFLTTIASLYAELHATPRSDGPLHTRLPAGARVVLGRQAEVGNFVPLLLPTGETAYVHRIHLSATYQPSVEVIPSPAPPDNIREERARVVGLIRARIAPAARMFVGIPYLWGGTTPFGLDCSGFTQLVYRLNGLLLLRDARLQWMDKRFVAIEEAKALENADLEGGDLVFFGRDDKITHVGIALGNGSFSHSAGNGRGNTITSCGDDEFGALYVGARRLSADADLAIDNA